jgi:drug/metabolite transporter (DMT)-like permease
MDYGLLYWGEQYLSAGVTAIFFATFALFTALMSNFVFKNEPFQLRQFAGLLIGFGGIMTVFYDQLIITRFNLKVILGSSAILVAALSAAISMVMIKKFLPDMNSVTLTFHQVWMGTLMLFALGFAAEDPGLIQANFKIVSAILYLGVIGSMLAFVVYYNLLKQMSAISLSLIIYVIPLIALVSDFLYYGEVIELRSFVGMFIIFCGIWLSREHKKKPEISPLRHSN